MKKVYLLVFNDATIERAEIKDWADRSVYVETWRSDLPTCFYLVSEASASELSQDLSDYLEPGDRFLISEVSENCDGWLTPDSWYFFQNRRLRQSHKSEV